MIIVSKVGLFLCLPKDSLENLVHLLHSVTENLSITFLAGGEAKNSRPISAESITEIHGNDLLPSLPKPIYNSPSMFLHNETILICGGEQSRLDQSFSKNCISVNRKAYIML